MNRSSDSTDALHAPTTDVVPVAEALPGCQAPESSPRTAAAPNALKRCVKRCVKRCEDDKMDMENTKKQCTD